MPIIKIIKDGVEVATIIVATPFEIRVVYGETVAVASAPMSEAKQGNATQRETTTAPPATSVVEPQPPVTTAAEQRRLVEEKSSEEVKEVLTQEFPKVEETSRKIMKAVEDDKDKKEKKEDIALIRKVIEGLIE